MRTLWGGLMAFGLIMLSVGVVIAGKPANCNCQIPRAASDCATQLGLAPCEGNVNCAAGLVGFYNSSTFTTTGCTPTTATGNTCVAHMNKHCADKFSCTKNADNQCVQGVQILDGNGDPATVTTTGYFNDSCTIVTCPS
jgi:hypothetical protein